MNIWNNILYFIKFIDNFIPLLYTKVVKSFNEICILLVIVEKSTGGNYNHYMDVLFWIYFITTNISFNSGYTIYVYNILSAYNNVYNTARRTWGFPIWRVGGKMIWKQN